MTHRGLSPATREAYGRIARGYLVYLEGLTLTSIEEVGPDAGLIELDRAPR